MADACGDAVLTPLAVDSQMLMCLIANSVATVAVVVLLDWVNRAQRVKDDDRRFGELCQRLEREREGWGGEKKELTQRLDDLEQRVRKAQELLADRYRAQLVDHQERMDTRIEALRHGMIAHRLAERERSLRENTGSPPAPPVPPLPQLPLESTDPPEPPRVPPTPTPGEEEAAVSGRPDSASAPSNRSGLDRSGLTGSGILSWQAYRLQNDL
eukprot:Hpha_TRINITY_DN34680_c0_g1::TRINITY_DN34680_c0_g1_i1::g.20978::m.20978